jgi:hypothetical protein
MFAFLAQFKTVFKKKNFFNVFLKTDFCANNQTPNKFFSNIVHHSELQFFLFVGAVDAPSDDGKEFFK